MERLQIVGFTHKLLFILLILSCQLVNGIRWLALSRMSTLATVSAPSMCEQLQGSLIRNQIQFCKRHPGFMDSVKNGAAHAIDECQFQFRTRRWNCSTVEEVKEGLRPFRRKNGEDGAQADEGKSKGHSAAVLPQMLETVERSPRALGDKKSNETKGTGGRKRSSSKKFRPVWGPYPVVPSGTREAAFVHAISAAGVAHAVTRACSGGDLDDCGCDRTVRGLSPAGFQWSGCSDNIDFGTTFSRTFVDAREDRLSRKSGSTLALMNLHNNEAGRKMIEKSMKIDCKCHGVSGSCELKTCWKAMPSFREIGEMLKEKFDGATEVEQQKVGSRRQLVPRNAQFKPHTDTDLVYLRRSPDFCEYDDTVGSLGTHGRECNKTSKGIDGCDLLCCNRGYKTHKERRVERCMCKFHWCCYVECKECIREVEVHTCH